MFPSVRTNHYAASNVPRCISYYEAFKGPPKPSNQSEIYRAITSVTTYLNYRRDSRVRGGRKPSNFSEFYLPIIVVDGCLFEASVQPDSRIDVRLRPHIQLRTFHDEEFYIVDVVTRAYFKRFFGKVERFHRELTAAIKSISLSTEIRVAVNAVLKRQEQTPSRYVRDMLLMMRSASTVAARAGVNQRKNREPEE